MTTKQKGAYGADDALVDFILGITFEIWEQRQIELIRQYYGESTEVFALSGVSIGSEAMIDGTRSMLSAFPDRLLLADDVIWSGSHAEGFYSSHRILSPMTNKGPTMYGPATGQSVKILSIADCVVEQGVITREWLLRDNHALVRQLGFDPVEAARVSAASQDDTTRSWMEQEFERVAGHGSSSVGTLLPSPDEDAALFAQCVLANHWSRADAEISNAAYAPYAVLYRSPVEFYSGRDAILDAYGKLNQAFTVRGISVDHVAVQPADSEGVHVAVRWTAAAKHDGDYLGIAPTGRDVFVLGATHWRIVDERIAIEWTVFDSLAVMSQLVEP
ncbi:MAG: ester cyclase [Gammaproteobacteria bacterium]|nr:ester cyclase [Gammaproteobacteria bacterium]